MALFIFTSSGWADTACTWGASGAPGRGPANLSLPPRTRCRASVVRLRVPGAGRRGMSGFHLAPGGASSALQLERGPRGGGSWWTWAPDDPAHLAAQDRRRTRPQA